MSVARQAREALWLVVHEPVATVNARRRFPPSFSWGLKTQTTQRASQAQRNFLFHLGVRAHLEVPLLRGITHANANEFRLAAQALNEGLLVLREAKSIKGFVGCELERVRQSAVGWAWLEVSGKDWSHVGQGRDWRCLCMLLAFNECVRSCRETRGLST